MRQNNLFQNNVTTARRYSIKKLYSFQNTIRPHNKF